jgi:inward rectifier potassium channel
MTAVDEAREATGPRPVPNIDADLGFGAVVARETRTRLLNRDGTFNVKREGLRLLESLSVYHYLITISWTKFLGYVVLSFVVINAVFGAAFLACGPNALAGPGMTEGHFGHFAAAFFFSVHTLATIGYGSITPRSLGANIVVAVESLIGLMLFAIVAGIGFARFSRPVAQILFSRNALIAPYRGMKAFMFRIVNQRSNELVQLEAKLMFARRKKGSDIADREFVPLKLERERVVFFPLSWTVVHPIDKESPLFTMSDEDLRTCDAEFLILLNGFDETFSQTVHTRSSYVGREVVWGARFVGMFNPPREDGKLSVDIRKLHDFERVPLPT